MIDPKEPMMTVLMPQLHPTGDLTLDNLFQVPADRVIIHWRLTFRRYGKKPGRFPLPSSPFG